MGNTPGEYLMAGQTSELDRLRLQSLVWEDAGRRLLGTLPAPTSARALDLGCGCLGWLRVLSEWVGPDGEVIGTDIDDRLLALAADFVAEAGLRNVRLVHDDMFASALPAGSFDLVHARFQIAPIGRANEIAAATVASTRRGGWVILEDPDRASWHFHPDAPACDRLIDVIVQAFRAGGGDFDAGRAEPALLRSMGLDPIVRTEVQALEPGHPYLALPLQFSRSLEPRLLQLMDTTELDDLRHRAEQELADPGRWGTTFTLVQTVARIGE